MVRHSIGDFVPAGAMLLEVYGGDRARRRDEEQLRDMVALGAERTIEQDPAFAIRIMVDIADKALSPAINDPTTAVQVLDHLSDVLRLIGTVDLSGSARGTASGPAATGIVIPVRRWEDYLVLATTEIREYGPRSIQVMRRMRAMLEELRDEVLPSPPGRGRGGAGAARRDRRPRSSETRSTSIGRASPTPRGSAAASAPGCSHTVSRGATPPPSRRRPAASAPAREHRVHLLGADDRLGRDRQLDRVQDERPGLGSAQAAVEGDQLLERAALLELGVIEAVDHDVGDVLEPVGPAQVRGGVGRERRQRVLALDPPLVQVVGAVRRRARPAPCSLERTSRKPMWGCSRSAGSSLGCRSSISSSVRRRRSSIR